MKSMTSARCGLLAGMLTLLAAGTPAHSEPSNRGDSERAGATTLAVFGDWPYSQFLLNNAHLLINSVNADPSVDAVVHVGDIHSGSMPCTSAGILPPIAASNPGWNQAIYYQFQQFNAPVVYTPGDNEWADCHKSKQFSSGHPLKELASVRSLFFAKPGVTLGRDEMAVRSQGQSFDPAYPTDAQFVENVLWEQAKVVFATFNIPGGSNDDASAWTAPFNSASDQAAQAAEISERRAANLRWLQTTFDTAARDHARAVVIIEQADMWDPEAVAAGGAGLGNYTPFVQKLAALSLQFGRPVLVLNGDTHLYLADRPLADPTSTTGVIHHTPAVPNLSRIVVQGSTNAPAEWLKLKIDTRTTQVFSWENVAYCANPLGGVCQ
jgi:hypothetical protein